MRNVVKIRSAAIGTMVVGYLVVFGQMFFEMSIEDAIEEGTEVHRWFSESVSLCFGIVGWLVLFSGVGMYYIPNMLRRRKRCHRKK